MSTIKSSEELTIWQQSHEFCKDIFRITNYDQFSKDYRLCKTIRNKWLQI